jgi:hypothetical protein
MQGMHGLQGRVRKPKGRECVDKLMGYNQSCLYSPLDGVQRVAGSNPVVPTSFSKALGKTSQVLFF